MWMLRAAWNTPYTAELGMFPSGKYKDQTDATTNGVYQCSTGPWIRPNDVNNTESFIAGTQVRAPKFSQQYGLEWAWRMMKNPRRLGPRYARCLGTVPQLVARSAPQIFNARMRKAA